MDEEQGFVVLEKIERKGMLLLLTFSNGFEVRATRGTVKKLELTEGFEFSPTGFREVKTLLLERFALYCAESLLARRNYSVGEFKERLRQKEIGLDMIKRIVAEFRRLDLLDDYRYGQMRVRSVIRRKPAGRGFLIADLQKRLVPRDIAEKVVTEALKDS
ncbi:MAG: RecX family transcriptional regulator, partial [FCB group bacterium]|nr:RecX family transcriptional regulator [FCB group bacterium]